MYRNAALKETLLRNKKIMDNNGFVHTPDTWTFIDNDAAPIKRKINSQVNY